MNDQIKMWLAGLGIGLCVLVITAIMGIVFILLGLPKPWPSIMGLLFGFSISGLVICNGVLDRVSKDKR